MIRGMAPFGRCWSASASSSSARSSPSRRADYLILNRLGPEAEAAFLEDLVEGTFLVRCLDRGELGPGA